MWMQNPIINDLLEDNSPLEYDVMQSGSYVRMFRTSLLVLSSEDSSAPKLNLSETLAVIYHTT
jgi:hypothetical protein